MENLNQTTHEEKFNFITEVISDFSNYNLQELKLAHTKLNFLCINFDPYAADEKSNEVENILNEFKLNDFIANPFEFTNIVLQILDKLDNEIKNRKH